MRSSRVQNKSALDFGYLSVEDRIPLLLAALNDEWDEPWRNDRKFLDTRALRLLVKRFQKLTSVIESDRKLFLLGPKDVPIMYPSFAEILDSINRFLKRYAAVPFIVSDFEFGAVQSRGWQQIWVRTGKKEQQEFLELQMVLFIVAIAQAGRISSLKQCNECHKWLLARFTHQRFCSTECKDRFHITNETDKARRREWARANYQARKELELGSRKAARRRGGKK